MTKRSLFREVNARIRALSEGFGTANGTYHVMCECGADGCMQRVDVPSGVFAEVHRAHGRFVVAPGHEQPGSDRVVAETAAYSVVTLEPA